jgi:hypothetical protein
MARVVHKYEVGYGEAGSQMPLGAKLLHVDSQPKAGGEGVFVWAEVDPAAPLVRQQIGYFATGEDLPEDAEYVGTAVTPGGAFVWHVYERVQF